MELLLKILLIAPPLLVAVILHEIAHGVVAGELGDPTARRAGRITLNPLKHVDLFMTILLPAALILSGSPLVFGGAKPVPVDASNFRSPIRDMGLVAVAGPVTNLTLALVSFALLTLLRATPMSDTPLVTFAEEMLQLSVIANIILCFFNLFPIPPLDGGRIAVALLPRTIGRYWAKLERVGLILIVFLLVSGVVSRVLEPILEFTLQIIEAPHL